MLTKKLTKLLLLVLSISSVGIALADSCDFRASDLNRLLSGDKNMFGAKLEGANLKCKDLSGINFKKADLDETDLSNSNLSHSNFHGAGLEEANLSNSNLSNANFQDADLEEANLKGANIKGTNFKDAELEFATWVDGRVCAEGSIGGCW